jgi:TonB family protein
MNRLYAWITLVCALAALVSCRNTDATRFLVVTETTHFELRSRGSSLGLPIFAGTLGAEQIVHNVSQAEYYFSKLSSVYGEHSFVYRADSTAEFLLPHGGKLPAARSVYGYDDPDARLDISLLSFDGSVAEYVFTARDTSGTLREHHVRIPAGQSASVGMLLNPNQQRGVLLAISVKALAVTPALTPDSLSAFLREKNAPETGEGATGYHSGDQRWMDELFGARAVKLPLPPGEPEKLVPMDVMPLPIGGMNALSEHIVYPPSAIRDTLEGRVLVDVALSERGEVIACKVIKGVRADLDSAAVNAVRPVRFTPAQYKGKPIAVNITIPFAFKLKP